MDQCKENDPQGIFGGEFLFQRQPFYMIFSHRNISSYKKSLQQMISGISAIPEIVYLYHFLIDEGFSLSRLYHLSPIPLTPQRNKKEMIPPFTIPQPQMTIATLYLELFKKVWPEMNRSLHIQNIVEIDSNEEIPLKRKFQEILQEVYLAFEEVSYSQILSSKKLPPLLPALHKAAPSSPLKKTFLATSGMSGYYHVMKSLKGLYGKIPKAAFLNTTYFEITHKPFMGKALDVLTEPEMDVTVEDFLTVSPGKWDVLFLDPYPNFVSTDHIDLPPIEKIIHHHLSGSSSPLTVVLDLTSTILHDPLLKRVIQTFDQEIQQGKLHLFFISSLAKFYTGGFDKYSGGFVQTYSTHPFNTLKTSLNNDPLSEEATTFFSLIFQERGEWLSSYFKTVQKNTDEMYRLLLPLQNDDHPICLCRKEETIPFIGLSLKKLGLFLYQQSLTNHQLDNITLFFKYFVLAKTFMRDLPLTSRESFGFPTTNLQTSGGALRLTVGVEDHPILEEVAQCLIEENRSIELELTTLSQETLKKLRYFFGLNIPQFTNWIEKMKLILIDFAKPHTFLETLHHFYQMIDPDKILHTILSSLSEKEKEWTLHWKEELLQLLQETFFSREHLETFIKHSLLPLKLHLEKSYTQTQRDSFINLMKKKKKLWLDFLLTHPIESFETYTQNVSAVYEYCAHLLLFNPSTADLLQSFKEEALAFAKNHTTQEMKSFLQKKDPTQSLSLS